MKVNLETLSTAAFAIRKRMQGYKLLKNPKGASPYEVNMIKSSFGLHFKYYDDMYSYSRIQRKKINGKTLTITRELQSNHFMDPKTKKITKQKEIWYSEYKNGKYVNSKDRQDLSLSKQSRRPEPKWKQSSSIFDAFGDEDIKYSSERFTRERMKSFYQPPISILENILTFGNTKSLRADSRPIAPGFFKTLFANLKG